MRTRLSGPPRFNPALDHGWIEVRLHDQYNNTQPGLDDNNPIVNFQAGADMVMDNVFSRVIAFHGVAGAANNAKWAGETIYANAYGGEDRFSGTSAEGGDSVIGIYGRQWVMESRAYIDVATLPTATMISGIAMGASNVVPIAASPARALVALYARWDNLTWELLVAKGNATAASKIVLAGVAPPAVLGNDRLRILFDPVAKVVEASINGVLGARMTDATKFPDPAVGAPSTFGGMNCFGQSGSNAGGNISCAFYGAHYYVKVP